MKQNKEKFDFKAFGQAIKAARKAKGISRNQLADVQPVPAQCLFAFDAAPCDTGFQSAV